MLTRSAPATRPDTGLPASLGAWTWPCTAADGQQVAHLLLAHRIGRTRRPPPPRRARPRRRRRAAGRAGAAAAPAP
ncbi:hypothetical protein, partial [Streptomyces chryseus]